MSTPSEPILTALISRRKAKRPASAGRVPTEYQLRHQPRVESRMNRADRPASKLRIFAPPLAFDSSLLPFINAGARRDGRPLPVIRVRRRFLLPVLPAQTVKFTP